MAYISFEQQTGITSVRTVSDLTIPVEATHAELQVDQQDVRYRMDGGAPTSAIGMLLLTRTEVKLFLIKDLRNIQFIEIASGARLNIHYIGRET